MSMSYSHLLIPKEQNVPSEKQITEFFKKISELFFSDKFNLQLKDFEGKNAITRVGRNPVTNEECVVKVPETKKLEKITDITNSISKKNHFNIEMSTEAKPRNALLKDLKAQQEDLAEIKFPYFYAVLLCIRPYEISMSSTQQITFGDYESKEKQNYTDDAVFENPQTAEEIQVPGAGKSRWWIQLDFGKWLFPEMKNNNLDCASDELSKTATEIFKTSFYQGCTWG